jgi:hypothetical protein
VERHEALRVVIDAPEGELRGRVLEMPEIGDLLERHDVSGSGGVVSGEIVRAFVERGFDLGRDASLRGCLICEGGERHILALVAHHGAADGSSVAVLCSELGAFYEACLDSREAGTSTATMRAGSASRWRGLGNSSVGFTTGLSICAVRLNILSFRATVPGVMIVRGELVMNGSRLMRV